LRQRSLEKHLETLLRWGWIEEVETLGLRRFKLRGNGRVEALKRLFKEVGYA
jgi:hypothetical protein